MVVGTMVLSLMAVVAGALCLLFFALFTSFYFRNRREAMALRHRLAADALGATEVAPVKTATPADGTTAAAADATGRPEGE